MFDIGLLEIFVILIVALIVIGPERMPEVARKLGQLTGKTKRFIDNIKSDSQIQSTVHELKDSFALQETQAQLQQLHQSLQQPATPLQPEPTEATEATKAAKSTPAPTTQTQPVEPTKP